LSDLKISSQWYALRSKPRKEYAVWKYASNLGYEVFYPRLIVQPVNPRASKIRPYFPGYLFVHVNLETSGISTFQWMTNAIGLVSFGGEPAVVPEALINAIKQRMQEIQEAGGELFEQLQSGDQIHIEYGPFQGYEAIFDARLPGTARVRVLLHLLSDQYVSLELNVSNIIKNSRKKGNFPS